MSSKRGMVMSFMIIFGIIILILVFFTLANRDAIVGMMKPKVSDVSPVQIYVENCVDAVSQYAVYRVGKQGGSINLNAGYFSNPFLEVNYAFDSVKTFGTVDELQFEIEDFINNNLKNCTAGFIGFQNQGMKIKEGEVKTSIILAARSVIVSVEYPLVITSGDNTFAIDKFQKDIPVRLSRIHSDIDGFLPGLKYGYNLTYLRGTAANTYIIPFDGTDIVVAENLGSRIFNENYLFIYGVR